MEDLTPEMEKFMQEENIEILHYRTEGNKEPFLEISTEDINHALVKLLDKRSHPGMASLKVMVCFDISY